MTEKCYQILYILSYSEAIKVSHRFYWFTRWLYICNVTKDILRSIYKVNILFAGILIEPNIDLYQDMVRKNRDASYINSCLSPTNLTEEYDFVKAYGVGGIKGNNANNLF